MHTVSHAIIHKLIKEPHGIASVVERDELLPLSAPVVKLVSDIHELYSSRASKGYGKFDEDEISHPSAAILRRLFKDNTITFVQASKQLLGVLRSKATLVQLATGGYVLMAQVVNQSNARWFVVAIINNVNASAIKDDSLEIVDAVHVDLDNLRVAGRVNVNDWLDSHPESRYVGFLKHQGDVAEYFQQFLGCNELRKDTEETKKLVLAIKSIAKELKLSSIETDNFLRSAYDYCHSKYKSREPLNLDELSNAIWPKAPRKLQKALASVEICDGFVPDGRVINGFVKIKGRARYWSLDLDRYALVSGDAKYLPGKGQLILKNLPDELKAQLDTEISDGK